MTSRGVVKSVHRPISASPTLTKLVLAAILLTFAFSMSGQGRPLDVAVQPFAMAPADDLSAAMVSEAMSLDVHADQFELFEVNEVQPVRVLKMQTGDQTLLLFHVVSTGQEVFASITGPAEATEMRMWDAGPNELVFSAGGVRVLPRSANGEIGSISTNSVVDNLLCLGRAVGIDFSNLSGSGLTSLISRASCTGANSLALFLTAASCLTIPHPMGVAGCVTGMAQIISCGIVNCATCTVLNINVGNSLSGSYQSSCNATHRNAYAKFYKFQLTRTTNVTIDLASSVDTYLYLLEGNGTNGRVIQSDDDGGPGVNSRITRSLSAGTYTIEATTYSSGRTGSFTLSIR